MPFGVFSKLGDKGRMARPFVVVSSGKTRMLRVGFAWIRSVRDVSSPLGGAEEGGESAEMMVLSKVVCRTRRVPG